MFVYAGVGGLFIFFYGHETPQRGIWQPQWVLRNCGLKSHEETLRKLLPAFVDSQLPLTQIILPTEWPILGWQILISLHCLRTLWQWQEVCTWEAKNHAALTRAWSRCEWWSPSRTAPLLSCGHSVQPSAPSTTGPACSQCWLTLGDPLGMALFLFLLHLCYFPLFFLGCFSKPLHKSPQPGSAFWRNPI